MAKQQDEYTLDEQLTMARTLAEMDLTKLTQEIARPDLQRMYGDRAAFFASRELALSMRIAARDVSAAVVTTADDLKGTVKDSTAHLSKALVTASAAADVSTRTLVRCTVWLVGATIFLGLATAALVVVEWLKH